MAQAFLIQKSGGGGVNQTLPEQVTAFHAAANSTPAVTLTWTNPIDHFGGVLIVKKIGTAPTSPTDGEKIYKGEGTSYTDFDVQFDTEYFYRAFPFNEKKQYQTVENVASAKPVSGIPLSELAEGTLIAINRAGVATNHYLACHDYESGLNGAGRQLMVPEDCYDKRVWNNTRGAFYFESDIDAWENGDYKSLFSEAVQTMMSKTVFYCTINETEVSTIERDIFQLSLCELNYTYEYALVEGTTLPIYSKLRVAYCNGAAVMQWTRTRNVPYSATSGNISTISRTGTAYFGASPSDTNYSRPCFTLPANAMVYPTPNADGSYTLIEAA